VLPWLLTKTLSFLKEDGMIEVNAENNFNEGIAMPKVEHKMAIKNEARRKEQAEQDRIQAIEDTRVAKLARKEDRRVKRRIRDIDGMVEIIKKEILEKGDMREGVTSSELDQITANYKQNTQVVGSIGGMMV